MYFVIYNILKGQKTLEEKNLGTKQNTGAESIALILLFLQF